MKDIIVTDCQYDFIDGSLACGHSFEAVKNIIAFINQHPDYRVFYSADWHSPKHCNYAQNGGIWAIHCLAGTHGAEFHESFYSDIKNPSQRPNESNIFHKGDDDSREEYSTFEARDKTGRPLNQVVGDEVIITGIASEFCVRESVVAFLGAGRRVEVDPEMLAWVDEAGHYKTMKELAAMGVIVHD